MLSVLKQNPIDMTTTTTINLLVFKERVYFNARTLGFCRNFDVMRPRGGNSFSAFKESKLTADRYSRNMRPRRLLSGKKIQCFSLFSDNIISANTTLYESAIKWFSACQ